MPRPNSGPHLRPPGKRPNYYIVWTEGGRSGERSTRTSDRRQAESQLADFLHLRARDDGPRDPSQVLITDALADYAEERGPKVAAPRRIGDAISPLSRFWEGSSIGDISEATCGRYTEKRARSAGMVRRELGILRAAVNHAHKKGRITRPVFVWLPQSPPPRDRWLTRVEAAALLRAALHEPRCRLYLPLFILICIRTGARKEAVLGLRWPQINLDRGRINFNVPGAKRTNKRRSNIPIPPSLIPHLRRARLRSVETGFVINDNGNRLRDIKRSFASACRRAGLDGVSPHTLRHTAATWLMQKGVDLWEAAGYLGMTTQTLQSVYAEHHPDHLSKAARALS